MLICPLCPCDKPKTKYFKGFQMHLRFQLNSSLLPPPPIFFRFIQDFSQKLQSKQTALTAVTEKVSKLTQGQESPEHKEVGHLSNHWLDLCLQTSNVLLQREEDLQRTKDYHDHLNVVEVFLEKFTQEWDNLAR